MTIETAVWCAMTSAYAGEGCGEGALIQHVHYDVEYDTETGEVSTSSEEQFRRHLAAAAGIFAWEALADDIVRDPDLVTAEFLMEHPAMVELQRRAREAAWDEAVIADEETTNPYRFERVDG